MKKFVCKAMSSLALSKLKKKTPLEKLSKPKKKIDRFDGLSEEEVQKYTLSDYLDMNLDIVFVGINPSLMAAHRGRYYAGPGNHFYKLLHESGLTPQSVTYEEDYKLLQYGIGLTNVVTRPTKSSAELKRTEIKEGSLIVEEKLKFYKPKIAVFNGKCIYEVFANKTGKFNFGLQPECIGSSAVWVTPSSSARCANFPRMVDKLHFYTGLKKYLQFLKGDIKDIDIKEFYFEGKCKPFIPSTSKMWRRKNVSAFLHGGRIANKDTICLDTSDENVAMAHSTEFIVKYIKPKINSDDTQQPIVNTESTQNYKKILLQEDIKTSCIDKTSLQNDNEKYPDDTLSIRNNANCVKIDDNDNVNTSESTKSMVPNNTRRKKTKIKRLSPKLNRTTAYTENTNSSEFINLIKQRLQEKANSGNIIDKEDL